MITKILFSTAKSQWCCNFAILKKVSSHRLLLWKIILSCRFDLILTNIHKSALLGRNLPVILFNHNNLNAMWQFHESRNLRDLHHPPLSQDHPLVYQRKCNFCIKDWQTSVTEGCHKWPRPQTSPGSYWGPGVGSVQCKWLIVFLQKCLHCSFGQQREWREVVKCGANLLYFG